MSYRPAPRPDDGLWWQIALGVFTGLLMFSALSGIIALAFGAYTANETEKAMKNLTKELQQPAQRITRSSMPLIQREITIRPLSNDERCIRGDRFKRLTNGWEQVKNDPCW